VDWVGLQTSNRARSLGFQPSEATSLGRVDMGIDWRNLAPTIYERLADNNLDSVIYYHDSTMGSTFNGLAGNPDLFGSLDDDFLPACEDDDLPIYSFLEPRFANSTGGGSQRAFSASDQHPDHNVREGSPFRPDSSHKAVLQVISRGSASGAKLWAGAC
jgi:hypothetical protein